MKKIITAERLAEKRGAKILIVGPTGVGKTSLLRTHPAAGSFTVMHAAHQLGRNFIGCDLMEA